MSRVHIIAVSFLALTLLGIVGSMDYEDQLKAEAHYCEMVGMWKSDAALGVPPLSRNGWPEDPSRPYSKLCRTEAQRLDDDLMAQRAGRE